MYAALEAWGAVDAAACNAYFQLALRGGHMAPAMRAAKHAEAHGLTQSLLMQSTLRQVRQYQKSVGARGGGGSTGDKGGGHNGDGGASEPFSM